MKVLTILGTRPEIIRLSLVIPKLDKFCDHVLVHTGQNHDHNLDKIFRDELGIREPDYYLGAKGTFAEQLSIISKELELVLDQEKPDAFLVLGDTNSSLGAIIARRKGIRVFHMEAGNRCHDPRSPEEVNRKLIDHCSDIHMPYSELSRANLLREGIPAQHIYVTGNPIKEVIDHFTYRGLIEERFILATFHRQENVDNHERLMEFIKALLALAKTHKVIWSVHPRTRKHLPEVPGVELREPMGFSEFINHERNAYCVLTDSGTVQEECAIFGVPCVTVRDSTERPETIECGSNMVVSCDKRRILKAIEVATALRPKAFPEEYSYTNVSDKVVKIVLGYWR